MTYLLNEKKINKKKKNIFPMKKSNIVHCSKMIVFIPADLVNSSCACYNSFNVNITKINLSIYILCSEQFIEFRKFFVYARYILTS